MDFNTQIAALRNTIETALEAHLSLPGTVSQLADAMRYCVRAGGKRIRPLMLLGAHQMYRKAHNPMPAAVAVELVHTYSLIHDDLPAMDNSPLRRGLPTCHIHFDEATAILAGDALLAHAFHTLTQSYRSDPALTCDLVDILANASGPAHLVGGQMDDILLDKGQTNPSPKDIRSIEERKTGALFSATLMMGARISGQTGDQLDTMDRLGKVFGRAFQITDDILDVTGNATQTGKPVGLDATNFKPTAVDEFGLDGARNEAIRLTDEGIALCLPLGEKAQLLIGLISLMRDRVA